jgi:hypothetical protein
MSELTRQGVRNLNPAGYNGHRKHGVRCRHFFSGALVVIGREWRTDPLDGEAYEEEVVGRRCLWCGDTREER